jgi:hypothetical protein
MRGSVYNRDQAIAQAGIPKYATAAKNAGSASLDAEAGESDAQ